MPRMSTAEKRASKTRSAAESILWATLEKVAKAEYARDELAAGKYDVAVQILAEVDGETVETALQIKTDIQGGGVYHPSVKAPADHLLACLWAELPETVRLRLAHDLPLHYETHKALPPVAEEHLTAIAKLVSRLTARGEPKPKAGAISASRV